MPKIPFWVFIIIAAVYFTAVRVDTMDIDASQYAGMSLEMLSSHNWLFLFDHGRAYLDKPPFLFWISALSMKVFGAGNFGYKFPSIVFALWSLYATYRLARLLYSEPTARMAALILASCQGLFLMVNDVRCDTILMSWVVTAIWLIKEWEVSRRLHYLLLGFAAAGMGMMTKGPIALMVPVFCFATDWALKRQWRMFFHPAYLAGLVIIGLVLLPMSIGLYQQFDLHPELAVNGMKGVSGLRFFYWSQSFGRITGESPWKNGADISFLLLNMLWSFLPWIFVLIPGIFINVISLIKQRARLRPRQEWLTTGGFLLTYLALGSSAYQLPHYIFVAFPLAAILTAGTVSSFFEGGHHLRVYKVLYPFLVTITVLVLGVVLALITYIFPSGWVALALWAALAGVWVWLAFQKNLQGKMILLPAAGIIIANIFLTNYTYYNLLQYQVGSVMGKYIHAEKISSTDFVAYKMQDPLNALSFYAQYTPAISESITHVAGKKYVLTMAEGLADMQQAGYTFDTLRSGVLFKVSELTPDFLLPSTRHKAVRGYYLLRVKPL